MLFEIPGVTSGFLTEPQLIQSLWKKRDPEFIPFFSSPLVVLTEERNQGPQMGTHQEERRKWADDLWSTPGLSTGGEFIWQYVTKDEKPSVLGTQAQWPFFRISSWACKWPLKLVALKACKVPLLFVQILDSERAIATWKTDASYLISRPRRDRKVIISQDPPNLPTDAQIDLPLRPSLLFWNNGRTLYEPN